MSTKADKAEAIRALLEDLKLSPGETVHTVIRNVARSGMTRWLDLYVIRDGEPRRITWNACNATGYTYDRKHEALKIGGCGMDMGFEAVYVLSRVLWPNGHPCTGKDWRGGSPSDRCPSNEHNNPGPGRDKYDPSVIHRDGGYSLRQRWM